MVGTKGAWEDWQPYQCKQCGMRFKATFELQKHLRINHLPSKWVTNPLAVKEVPKKGSKKLKKEVPSEKVCPKIKKDGKSGGKKKEVLVKGKKQLKTNAGGTTMPIRVRIQASIPVVSTIKRSPRTKSADIKALSRSSDKRVQNKEKKNQSQSKTAIHSRTTVLGTSISSADDGDSSLSSFASTYSPSSLSSISTTIRDITPAGFPQFIPSTLPTLTHSFEMLLPKPKELASGDSSSDNTGPKSVPVLINSNPLTQREIGVLKKSDFKNENYFPCPHCDYVAKIYREMQSHVNTHLARSYPCTSCIAIYRAKHVLLNHLKKCHPDQQGKEVTAATEEESSFSTSTDDSNTSGSSNFTDEENNDPVLSLPDNDYHPSLEQSAASTFNLQTEKPSELSTTFVDAVVEESNNNSLGGYQLPQIVNVEFGEENTDLMMVTQSELFEVLGIEDAEELNMDLL